MNKLDLTLEELQEIVKEGNEVKIEFPKYILTVPDNKLHLYETMLDHLHDVWESLSESMKAEVKRRNGTN